MSGHTPGPWRVELSEKGYPYGISAPNASNTEKGVVGKNVLRWRAFMLPTSVETKSNAHLIAAAPELLAALEAIVNAGWRERNIHVGAARAIIAKARGE